MLLPPSISWRNCYFLPGVPSQKGDDFSPGCTLWLYLGLQQPLRAICQMGEERTCRETLNLHWQLYPQPMLVSGKYLDHGRWVKQQATLTDKVASHHKPFSVKHRFNCSVGTKQTSKISFCCAMCNVNPFYMPHCGDLKETYGLLHTIFLPYLACFKIGRGKRRMGGRGGENTCSPKCFQ